MDLKTEHNLAHRFRGDGWPRRLAASLSARASRLWGGMMLAAAMLYGTPAMAHNGAEHALSFASGFAHPMTGLDHMLAMLTVGLWAGLNGGRALWVWPLAFVGVMLVGGGMGMSGVHLPAVDAGILASVVILGLLVLSAERMPVAAGAVLIGVFALLHGHAHGTELPATAAASSYMAGFAVATGMLHAAGLGAAYAGAGTTARIAIRAAGGVAVAAGLVLAVI
jgi:urease accessory protein